MQVFVFDLVTYGEHLDQLRNGRLELPYPLTKRYFKPEVAVQTYEEHLAVWEEMDRLGFDGVGMGEHHTTPHGLMNSPNLLVAAAAERTHNLKLLTYGNVLPLHDPLRLAEELSMLDCLSNGRLISGFVRGGQRAYNTYGIPPAESRARYEEAWEIIRRAWTEEEFSFEGNFWSYHDVAIWPRPVQQPHPPVWVAITGSKESIEFAARNNLPITAAVNRGRGVRTDVTNHYIECLEQNGFHMNPDHLITQVGDVYIADSMAQAIDEAAPYWIYYTKTLSGHGNVLTAEDQRKAGYLSATATDYIRPENLPDVATPHGRTGLNHEMTVEDIERHAEDSLWGTADEVRQRIIEDADQTGSNTVLININRGAMPQEMYLEQIRRFGTEVLPALHAHEVRGVPAG